MYFVEKGVVSIRIKQPVGLSYTLQFFLQFSLFVWCESVNQSEFIVSIYKACSHMSPMIGKSLSVTIQGENSQRILLMSSHKQWSSPMSAACEKPGLIVLYLCAG